MSSPGLPLYVSSYTFNSAERSWVSGILGLIYVWIHMVRTGPQERFFFNMIIRVRVISVAGVVFPCQQVAKVVQIND